VHDYKVTLDFLGDELKKLPYHIWVNMVLKTITVLGQSLGSGTYSLSIEIYEHQKYKIHWSAYMEVSGLSFSNH